MICIAMEKINSVTSTMEVSYKRRPMEGVIIVK